MIIQMSFKDLVQQFIYKKYIQVEGRIYKKLRVRNDISFSGID